MNPKNSEKSPIHENAGANITCDFGDGDISRSRSFLSNTCDTYIRASHIASSIIGRLFNIHYVKKPLEMYPNLFVTNFVSEVYCILPSLLGMI